MDENDCFKKEDRDELLRHGWQLAGIIATLKEMKDEKTTRDTDIENRLRALESFKWMAWGAGTIAGTLIGWFLAFMSAKK